MRRKPSLLKDLQLILIGEEVDLVCLVAFVATRRSCAYHLLFVMASLSTYRLFGFIGIIFSGIIHATLPA
jgi:hypothetical protein